MPEQNKNIRTFFKDNRELFVFIGIFFLFYIVAAFFDFFEFFHEYFDRYEHQELDEIFAVSTILFFAIFIFFLIRSSKLRKEIKAREEAEELANQLGELVEESLNEVYIVDIETLKFIQVNESARKNLGYTLQEITKFSPLDIKPGLDEKTFREMITPLLSGDEKRIVQISSHRRKDGSTYPVETYLKISTYKDRNVFVASVRDISERELAHSILLSEKNILEMISRENELSEILDHICLEVENQSNGMLCSFCLVDNSGKALVSCAAPSLSPEYAKDIGKLPIGPRVASCGTAAYTKKQVIAYDTATDPLWSDFQDLAKNHNLQACWSTPILSHSGELLGTFAMYYSEPREPIQEEIEIIERATNLARIAIERKKADDSLKKNLDILSKKSRYEEIISSVTRSVHSSIDIQEVLDNAVESLSKNISLAQNVSIVMVEEDQAVLKAWKGLPEWFVTRLSKIPKPKGFVWKVMTDGKMRYCPDVEKDKYIGPAGRELGTKSYLSVPFKHKGSTIGCISLHSFNIDAFSLEDINLIEFVASQIEAAISNAKQAEALRESEERYRTLYDQSPLGIFTFDRDLKLTSSNKRLLEIMKSSSYGIHGLDLTKLKDQKFTYLYHEALAGKPTHLEDIYSTTRSEIDLWLSISAAPLKDSIGKIHGGIAVVEDVTQRKKMEEHLIKSQKLESLGVLAGGIAHDFNNLLTSIMANLSYAKNRFDLDDELRELFSESEEATERASTLVSQLLTFSKGGAPVKKLFSDFNEFVSDIVKFTVSGSKVKAEFNLEDDLWNLEVDQIQISQVIQNLVINAMQAMPEGGLLKVNIDNYLGEQAENNQPGPGKYIRIIIDDTGTGISEDDLDKIFDPYFTTKEGGHGLGLSSVYSIVKYHGGMIDVESEIGIGTKFIIYLPASDTLAEADINHKDSFSIGKGKILLMDDENLIKIATGRMLTKLGYEVDYASDGDEAVQLYRESLNATPYDLVIMDLTVPGGMGGCEAIKILKSVDPTVKAIVSSGYSNDPILSDYKKYGFVDVVKKPYQLETLSNTIDSVLNGRTH